MESGLIKSFHDGGEHFDGYQSFDGSNIWEHDRDTMHLNLTHTLDGILPGSPTNTMVMDYDTPFCIEPHNEIKLEYDSEDEIQTRKISISSIESEDLMYSMPAVEIIPIDPNCEYSSPMRSNDEDDDDDDDDDEDEEESSSNNSSFNERRIRTNSYCSNQSFEENTEVQTNNIKSYMTENDCDKIFINNDIVRYKEDTTKLLLSTDNIINNNDKKFINKKTIYKKSVSLPLSPKNNCNQIIPTDLSSMTFEDLDFDDLNSMTYLSPTKVNNEFAITTPGKHVHKNNFINGENVIKEITFLDDYKLEESDIDVKNFDLTTYITEEDCKLPPPTPGRNLNICLDRFEVSPICTKINNNNNFDKTKRSVKEISKLKLCKSPAIKYENIKRGYKKLHQETEESDSDESIDVETVSETNFGWKSATKEAIKHEPDTTTFPIEDDVNRDPTWSPQIQNSKSQRTTATTTIRTKLRSTIPIQRPVTNPQIRMRILNAGAQLSSNKLTSPVLKSSDNIIQKDHDYCSPTKKISAIKSTPPPRRAIEIPTAYSILDRRQQRLGLGRGKNISMCSKPSTENFDKKESKQDIDIHWKYKEEDNKNNIQKGNYNEENVTQVKIEVIEEEKPTENKIKIEEIPIKKRKLNLQEYKMRRENIVEQKEFNQIKMINAEEKLCTEIVINNDKDNKFTSGQHLMQSQEDKKLKISDDKIKIIKMKNDNNKNIEVEDVGFDPIREATKKALRMQYLKKTNRNKISEPQIIPCNSIMPLLPLAELTAIKNDKLNEINKEIDNITTVTTTPYLDYEEIIIVSIGCNTVISISPNFISTISNNNKILAPTVTTTGTTTQQIDDILSRSSLLSNINDTINKAKSSGGNINITSNSLLSSITNVVLKKTTKNFITGLPSIQVSPNIGVSPPNGISPGKPEKSRTNILNNNNNINLIEKDLSKANDNDLLEHGEDKIIMHLKKDRIRPISYTISTQTESLVQFPLLKRLEKKQRKDDRNYRHYRNSSCSSMESENFKRNTKYNNNNSLLRRSRKSPSPKRRRHQQQHSLLRTNNNNHNSRKSNSPKRRSRSPLNNFSVQNSYSSSTSRSKRRSRSISKDKQKQYYRTESRCSSISHSSTSSDISRTRNRNNRQWNQRRYSTSSSHSSSASSRSRSRGSSKSRHSTHQNSCNNGRERHASPEERRIVYVGRIEREVTKEDLKSKFVSYGPIKQITIHHKETGLKYGFVTYERAQDAFTAIEVSGRDPKISMYDISFGGRRAFCRNLYSDLDGTGANFQNSKPGSQQHTKTNNVCDDSFEALLQKVKDKIGAKKPLIKT